MQPNCGVLIVWTPGQTRYMWGGGILQADHALSGAESVTYHF